MPNEGSVPTEGRPLPTPVGRERGDAVDTTDDEVPQFLGRADPSRVPAAHRDDGDRVVLVGGVPLGERLARVRRPEQFGVELGGEIDRVGVVEDQGRWQLETRRAGEPGPQFDRRQRVEPEFPEGPVQRHRPGAAMPEHGGGLRANQGLE